VIDRRQATLFGKAAFRPSSTPDRERQLHHVVGQHDHAVAGERADLLEQGRALAVPSAASPRAAE
jgi:hypothetical protein